MGNGYSSEDPITYEIFKHRLWSICERSHYTLSRVSGSPVVVDAHEYLSGLHKASGDAVMVTSGVVLHLVGMEQAIKKIMEWWPLAEIEDGDQFLVNDPFVANLHAPDMSISRPVFYRGELVAWVGSLYHTSAVPADMEPGSMITGAVDAFQEGLRAQGIKIVERGKVRQDIMRTLTANARDPDLLGLDHAAKIAANNVAADQVIKMVGQFRLDYVKGAFERIIDETEEIARGRLRRLPDGTWRSVLYQDSNGREPAVLKFQTTMTKKGDTIRFDYSGTDPQQRGSLQCAEAGALGQLYSVLASQLFWDAPWNHGLLRAIEYVFPPGSLVNAQFPMPVSHAPHAIIVANTAHQCVAKMFMASEDFREDINAGWASAGSPKFGGVNQYGRRFAAAVMNAFASGIGARHDMDGVNSGGLMMTPESEISNCESHEMTYPMLYLWRKECPETQGHGKFRGGVGIDYALVPHRAPEGRITVVLPPGGNILSYIPGLSGGYPGSIKGFTLARSSDVKAQFQERAIPGSLEDIRADKLTLRGTYDLQEADVAYFFVAGGGGYGDPLDRDPNMVLADVAYGATSGEVARDVYGVLCSPVGGMDDEATQRQREAIRQDRLRRGCRLVAGGAGSRASLESSKATGLQPAVAPDALAGQRLGRQPITRMTEYLGVFREGDRLMVGCLRCGYWFCDAQENYKLHALVDERPPSKTGLRPDRHPSDGSGMRYREFYCPGCATMLEVDLVMEGDPILHDIQLDPDWLQSRAGGA